MSTAYTTAAAVEARIAPQVLTDALDDDGDGERDSGLLEQIIANASSTVDGMICNRVATPLDSPPASVVAAALWFTIEEIYGRRQMELPKNFATAIAAARAWLTAVREGKQNLDAATPVVLKAGGGGNPQVPGRVPVAGSATTY